jgi:hypothetical protein
MSKNIFIDGDKSGFNSKIAVDKFKALVKSDNNVTIESLKEKYIKQDYTLQLVEKTDTDIKFKLFKNVLQETVPTEPLQDKKQLLKAKLKNMRDGRTNVDMHKAKTNKDIPEDILAEYIKLKKVVNMPIPEPGEILAKPEQYKPMISMVLGNDMMKQVGSNHPYTKYFRLLADKLGVTEVLPIPTQDYGELLKSSQVKSSHVTQKPDENKVVNIKGNDIKNDDTDSESDES